MRDRIIRHTVSFRHAFRGLFYSFSSQPNFIIHLIIATIVIVTGFFLHVSRIEMLILIFTILLVFLAEMINTALESITDLVTTEWRTEAKIAKDVSAGMVLIAAIGAIIIGIVIFGGYIL